MESDDGRARFREVEVAGVDSAASQHVRDELWDLHIRVSGTLPQAWRGLFDEEFRKSLDGDACDVRYADRHIVILCAPMAETEARLEQVRRVVARANRRYRTEVLPHIEALDPARRRGARRTAEQRRRLQRLDPMRNGDRAP